jgi:hypothetical protein
VDPQQLGHVRSRATLARSELVITVALKDYETIAKMRDEVVSVGENRLNFFLATVVGALGVIALVPGQLEEASLINRDMVGALAAVGVAALVALGLSTFARMIRRYQTLVRYTFALERARSLAIETTGISGKLATTVVNLERPLVRTGLGVATTVGLVNVAVVASAALVLAGTHSGSWIWPTIAALGIALLQLGYAMFALRADSPAGHTGGRDDSRPSRWLRSMIGLALVVVVARFVVGSLVAPTYLSFVDLLLVAVFTAAFIDIQRSGQ